ncbi:hypothetical protein [Streptomyces sp. NPDC055013]
MALEDVLNEYRENTKFLTDDLLMHKAALKNAEKQIAQLQSELTTVRAEGESRKVQPED